MYSKKAECKKGKLDLDNYDTSSEYMKDKIYNQFKKELIKKIKKKFKNHDLNVIHSNIINNSSDKKIIKLKVIEDERYRLNHLKEFNRKKHNDSIKSE